MKIGLIGYGKMGKTIESLINESAHNSVQLIVNSSNRVTTTINDLKQCDVIIEFTEPDSAVENIKWCLEAGVPVVVGTTAWLQHLPTITKWCNELNGAVFYSPNYSIGVNIFWEVNRKLAKLMSLQHQYDVSMEEIHHTEKKDAPSGTAVKTAEVILNELHRKNNWTLNSKASELDLLIVAKREPNVPGTHTVSYKSNVDCIQITHEAYNRKGFAEGAIMAANWLYGRQGVFQMSDMLNEL